MEEYFNTTSSLLSSLVKDPAYFMKYIFNQRRDDMIKRAIEYQQSEFHLANLSPERYQQLTKYIESVDGTFGNSYGQFIVMKKTHTDNSDVFGHPLADYHTYSLSFKLN
jgi:hypothetical protein